MDDDANPYEVDARLREILNPPRAAIDRVMAGVLARRQDRQRSRRWRWAPVTVAALFVVVIVIWQRAVRREPRVPITTVSKELSLLVVKTSDGRRWLFTPQAPPRSGGHYVIVVSE